MQALDGRAECECTQRVSIHTGAAGAGTLRVPFGAFLIFYTIQHTRYNEKRGVVIYSLMSGLCVHVCVCECIITFADWTAEMWVYNGIGALDRRTILFMANDIPTL